MCYFLLEYVLKLAPKDYIIIQYRKIPKISPGAYIFQRPFLRGLFFFAGGGLTFGRAYVRREICVSKSIGLACSGKEIYHFCFALLCIRGHILSTSPPGLIFGILQYNLVTYKCMINTLVTYGSPRTIFIKTNFITV